MGDVPEVVKCVLDTLQYGKGHFVADRIEFLTRVNQREGLNCWAKQNSLVKRDRL